MERYKLIIQDAINAYVLDKEEETIVCLCNTKRPGLEFCKLKELINKANQNSVDK